MTKIFFSYASEDAALVDAVYGEFVTEYPHHEPWLDKYEIVGGDSLLEKIASGMNEADKFFVFLSPVAITKPWVQRELRRALMREIQGVDPSFIVPVKIGDLREMPAFLEDKKYIDVSRLRREEWLAQFDAAIRGEAKGPSGNGTSNVQVTVQYSPEGRHIARVIFQARAWAEQFSWAIATREAIVKGFVEGGGVFTMISTVNEPRIFAQRFATPELRPGQPIVLCLVFGEGVDALAAIERVAPWVPTS
jgi:hypothetical protein